MQAASRKSLPARPIVRIGCSGFMYDHWRGPFYASDLPKRSWFEYYRRHFDSVEMNVTFYRLPKAETMLKWYNETPHGYTFALKGSRFITHVKRLAYVEEPVARFFEVALKLREKLAVILWQFPPGFSLAPDRLATFIDLLAPYEVRKAFEFRDESWMVPDVVEALRLKGLALCGADWPPWNRKPPGHLQFCLSPASRARWAVRFRLYGSGTEGGRPEHPELPETGLRCLHLFQQRRLRPRAKGCGTPEGPAQPMKPALHPHLVNDAVGDPVLYIDFLYDRRALLMDLGDIHTLSPGRVLRISDIFVSHTHMDHFIGFDHLLRILLGREHTLRIYGPPGIIDRVDHKLAGYTWNLVENYDTDFTLRVTEMHSPEKAHSARFRCKARFRCEDESPPGLAEGVLLDEETFRVRAVELDHRMPCLAFALEEKIHINIWKNRLEALGLPTRTLAAGPQVRRVARGAGRHPV